MAFRVLRIRVIRISRGFSCEVMGMLLFFNYRLFFWDFWDFPVGRGVPTPISVNLSVIFVYFMLFFVGVWTTKGSTCGVPRPTDKLKSLWQCFCFSLLSIHSSRFCLPKDFSKRVG